MTAYDSCDHDVHLDVSNQNGISDHPQNGSKSKVEIVKEETQDSTPIPWRVHLSSIAVLVLTVAAAVMNLPLLSQYVYYRTGLKYFNATNHIQTQSVPCEVNSSLAEVTLQQRVQQEATYVLLIMYVLGTAPVVIVNIFVGSYSDMFGRKMLFYVPLIGYIVRGAIFVVVVYCDWELYIMYPVSALEGSCGGVMLIQEGVFVVNADVTHSKRRRTVVLAFLEGSQMLASSLASLATGLLILHLGYKTPAVVTLTLLTLALITAIVFVPNTAPARTSKTKFSPWHHVKNFMSFYVKGSSRRKLQYRLTILTFFLALVNVLGRLTVTTLYQLNRPFCWDSSKIGYFGAIQRGLTATASTAAVAIGTRCFRPEGIAIIGLLSTTASLILEGLAYNDVMFYLVAVVGLLGQAPIAVCRILMSKWTPPEKQGAMFSGIAAMQGVCFLLANLVFNILYASTLTIFRGLVFLIMGGATFIAAGIMLGIRHINTADYAADAVTTVDTSNHNDIPSQTKEAVEEIGSSF